MEKLSRAVKYKDYRNSIQTDNENGINTDQLRDLQQRLIEVEKKFGEKSRTESDLNRGYKSSGTLVDAYDIFAGPTFEEEPKVETRKVEEDVFDQTQPVHPIYRDEPQIVKPVVQEPVVETPIVEQQASQEQVIEKTITQQQVIQEPVVEKPKLQPVEPIVQKENLMPTYEVEEKEENIVDEEVKEDSTKSKNELESALRGFLDDSANNNSDNNVEDFLDKIRNLLSERKSVQKESNKEDIFEQTKEKTVNDIFENVDEPEYIPQEDADTDSIPYVESLIDEINTIQFSTEDRKNDDILNDDDQFDVTNINQIEKEPVKQETYSKVDEVQEVIEEPVITEDEKHEVIIEKEEKQDVEDAFVESKKDNVIENIETKIENIAEFVESKKETIVESVLKDIKLEKPIIKPVIPVEDNSKEFSELCNDVNRLAKEIESGPTFGKAPYVPPRPELPTPTFELTKNDTVIDNNVSPFDNTFMEKLKDEVNSYNQSIDNVTINALKDELIDEQRHNIETDVDKESHKINLSDIFVEQENENNISVKPEPIPEPKKEENKELKKAYDATVNTEVNKLLDEIKLSKADDIPSADVLMNPDKTVVTEIPDINQGKTIAFEADDAGNSGNKENTIILSNPYTDDQSQTSNSIHTMSFQTEEIYESEEKSSTVLNIILTILIILAVGALAVIAYFFLLTRGII